MNNLKYLKDRKKLDDERKQQDSLPKFVGEWEIEYRRTKALEIIAEEFCRYNNHLNKSKKELDSANKLAKDFESKRIKK